MNEIIKVFLKLGTVGFGGPIALIGYIEDECVKKRNWLPPDQFAQFVSVAKLLPGPLATLIAIRVGVVRGGRKGGFAAGFCLILPAFLMILILAKASNGLDRIAFLNLFWVGLSLAAIVVSVMATLHLTKPVFEKSTIPKAVLFCILVLVGTLTFLFPRAEPLFIIGTGLFGFASHAFVKKRRPREVASLSLLLLLSIHCCKASLFTFGSGIAIVPSLRTVFIDEYNLISNQDFLRGLTLGQITPGPLVIVSTYLGYAAAGIAGSIATTFGTFCPTFILALFIMPQIERWILNSKNLKVFFAWLLPAVCGAIFGSIIRLLLFSVVQNQQWLYGRIALTVILLFLALRWKLSPGKVFLTGGSLIYLLH